VLGPCCWAAGLRISEALGLPRCRTAPLPKVLRIVGKGARNGGAVSCPRHAMRWTAYLQVLPLLAEPRCVSRVAWRAPCRAGDIAGHGGRTDLQLGLPASATPHALRHSLLHILAWMRAGVCVRPRAHWAFASLSHQSLYAVSRYRASDGCLEPAAHPKGGRAAVKRSSCVTKILRALVGFGSPLRHTGRSSSVQRGLAFGFSKLRQHACFTRTYNLTSKPALATGCCQTPWARRQVCQRRYLCPRFVQARFPVNAETIIAFESLGILRPFAQQAQGRAHSRPARSRRGGCSGPIGFVDHVYPPFPDAPRLDTLQFATPAGAQPARTHI